MRALVLAAVLVSGAAALVAEVVWFRGLGRGVGTSAEALAVVTAAFLGGLGVGAAVGGRRAAASSRPFRAAAVCEAVAGVLVVLSPWAVAAVPSLHLAVLDALSLDPGPSAWPAALVALPVLLLPCAFLGATLPFLVRGVLGAVGHVRRAGRSTGLLYAVNTLGAAAGVALAVFVLMPALGESGSLRVAGGGNVLAALLILLAERPGAVLPADEAPRPLPASSAGPARTAGVALLASGAFALGAEVAWFRLLEPLTDISAVGLAFLLVPVLLGTAIGGAVGGVVADRVRRPDLALAVAIGAGGLLTLLSLPASGEVPWVAFRLAADRQGTLPWKVGASALCMLPALVAYAASYPLAVRVRALTAPGAARAAGSVYAWNTAGNVIGSLFAGFYLLPVAGSPRTLLLLGALGLAFAAALWLSSPRPRGVVAAVVFLAPVALVAWPGSVRVAETLGPSLPEVVALGRWGPEHGRVRSRADLRAYAELLGGTYPSPAGRPDEPPILPREGRVGSVALLDETNGQVRVRQGGLSESVFRRDDPDAGSETEVALALVPYLLHSGPTRALVIGHGAGWTVETLLATDLAEVHVAELEPAVLEVVAEYRGSLPIFRAGNGRLHVADGRLLLRRAAARGGEFDLVVSQPSHPWVPGAGHLFTVEAYRLARAALRPGGVFAQWLNVFDMDRDLFQTALAGWHAVFPRSWLLLYRDEIVLVGLTAPARVDAARWERAFDERSAVGARARAAGIRGPAGLLRRLVADGEGIARILSEDARPATDDDPRLELGLARLRVASGDDSAAVLADLRKAFPPDLAAAVPDVAVRRRWVTDVVDQALDEHAAQEAEGWAQKVAFPLDARARRTRARLARAGSDPKQAEGFLRAVLSDEKAEPDVVADAKADLLDVLVEGGRAAAGAAEGEAFAAEHPDHGRVLEGWAKALVISGDRERAAAPFARALEARSPRPPAGTGHEYARLLLTVEPPRKEEARRALLADPGTFESIEALEELVRLETELGPEAADAPDGPDVPDGPDGPGRGPGGDGARALGAIDRYDALLEGLRTTHGERQLGFARRDFTSNPRRALRAAVAATEGLPSSSVAWRLRGWLELHERMTDRAVASFRRAVAVASEGDRPAERARAAAFLRMFSADPARLDAPDALPEDS